MKKLRRVYFDEWLPSGRAKKAQKAHPPLLRTGMSNRETKARRVGIWDMGAWVGYLEDILNLWNDCQSAFRFQAVYLSVPQQLTQGGDRTLAIARKRLSPRRIATHAADLRDNLHTDGLYPIADRIKDTLTYDQLVCLTPLMIASNEGDGMIWNFFSESDDGVIFISAYEVREFARKAKRPFEAAIGMLILAQILMDACDLDSHSETRGCLFDFNEDRESLIVGLKKMDIDPICFSKIKPDLRKPAAQLLDVLRNYKR